MWPIYAIPGFVTERQNDSLCLSVIKQILAERRVATRLGALRIGSDFSSCRGPSMGGISLAGGCIYIYTVHVYCWPAYTYVYTCTSIYMHGRKVTVKQNCLARQ